MTPETEKSETKTNKNLNTSYKNKWKLKTNSWTKTAMHWRHGSAMRQTGQTCANGGKTVVTNYTYHEPP